MTRGWQALLQTPIAEIDYEAEFIRVEYEDGHEEYEVFDGNELQDGECDTNGRPGSGQGSGTGQPNEGEGVGMGTGESGRGGTEASSEAGRDEMHTTESRGSTTDASAPMPCSAGGALGKGETDDTSAELANTIDVRESGLSATAASLSDDDLSGAGHRDDPKERSKEFYLVQDTLDTDSADINNKFSHDKNRHDLKGHAEGHPDHWQPENANVCLNIDEPCTPPWQEDGQESELEVSPLRLELTLVRLRQCMPRCLLGANFLFRLLAAVPFQGLVCLWTS